jgi:hypothetical protein
MILKFDILLRSSSPGCAEAIAWRSNEDALVAPLVLPYSAGQLEAILKALELLNRPSQLVSGLTIEDNLILSALSDEPGGQPYWQAGKLLPDFPRRVGYRLYQALFPGALGEAFREAYRQVLRSGDETQLGLALHFSPDDTLLARYPWELMRQAPDSPLLLLDRVRLSRRISTGLPLQEVTFPQPTRALMVVARPNNLPIMAASEREAIERALTQHPGSESALIQSPPSFFAFIDAVMDHRPRIIHFDGHGAYGRFCPACEARGSRTFAEWWQPRCPATHCQLDLGQTPSQGFLLFEDDQGQADFISAAQIGDRLAGLEVKLCLLSACQTATVGRGSLFNTVAPMLVQAGIPAVVAMQFSISAAEMARFSQRLYKSLVSGAGIETALTNARRLLSDQEIFRPVLYLRAAEPTGQGKTIPHPGPPPVGNGRFEKLRGWLDRLLDNEFRSMIYSLLTVAEQNQLSLPVRQIDRSTFLGDMQSLGRLEQVETYLSRKYSDRLRE